MSWLIRCVKQISVVKAENPIFIFFYDVLGSIAGANCGCKDYGSQISFDTKLEATNKWLIENPKSIAAQILLARLWINYAWQARDSGYTDKITKEQWNDYYARLKIAAGVLHKLSPKEDSFVYVKYTYLTELANNPKEYSYSLFKSAIQDYPTNIDLYTRQASLLQENWYGTPGELATFIKSVLQAPGGADGQIAYAALATYFKYSFSNDQMMKKNGLDWPKLKDAYKVLERKYTLSDSDWDALFNYAIINNDNQDAAEYLKRIKLFADQGNAPQINILASAYLTGIGVEKDVNESKRWYLKSATLGDSEGQFKLGWILSHIEPYNYPEALHWYNLAAA